MIGGSKNMVIGYGPMRWSVTANCKVEHLERLTKLTVGSGMVEKLEQDGVDVHINEVCAGDGGSGLSERLPQQIVVLHDSIVVCCQASVFV